MSDRIAVMNGGRIEQVGAPEELYERPRTRFAADFLGVRNLLQATVEGRADGRARLRTTGGLAVLAHDDGGYRPGERVWVGVRPERMTLLDTSGENVHAGVLEDELYLGDRTDWRVRLAGETLIVAEGAATAGARRRGDAVSVSFPAAAVLRLQESPLAEARPAAGPEART